MAQLLPLTLLLPLTSGDNFSRGKLEEYRIQYVDIIRELEIWFPDSPRCDMYSEIIPRDYNVNFAPVINNSPATVYISCQIIGIDNIKEATMDFRLLLYLIVIWKDPRLNLKNIVSDQTVLFPKNESKYIWMPMLAFPNSKEAEIFDIGNGGSVLKILPDQSLYYVARLNFLVDCPMELHDFPMDIQSCTFMISLMDYTDKEALIKWIEERDSPYKKLGRSIQIRAMNLLQFEMEDIKAHKVIKQWVTGNFTTLIAEFKFIRRLTGNLINVYIPSTLVVMLSWLSFWIDVNAAPARITLGVTSILTLVTHLVQSRNFVPPVDYLKAMDIWFIVCILVVFFSLMEYALAYQFSQRQKMKVNHIKTIGSQTKNDNSSLKVVKGWISHMKKRTQILVEAKDINVYDKLSRVLFPCFFIIFATFYWIYFILKREC